MNILITAGIFPPKVGGPATYVPKIAHELVERGHNIQVITPGKINQNDELNFPYPVHRTAERFPIRLLQTMKHIINKSEWADCIFDNALSLDVYLASHFHTVPTLQKIVGDRSWERYRNANKGNFEIDEFQNASVPLKTAIERYLQHTISRSMEKILVPSRYLKSIVSKWTNNPRKISVVYNTAHKPEDIPTQSVEWPKQGLKLLCVGRLVSWKRVPSLITQVSNIDNASLIVLGDGPEFDKCTDKISETDTEDRIQLKGNVPGPSVWQHLRDADALLLNSTYEGFPHIVLEAMACGTPVIASASGGTAEVAEFFPNKIALYEPNNEHRIPTLLTDFLPKQFEPTSFPDELQWDHIVEQTEELLLRTARSNG